MIQTTIDFFPAVLKMYTLPQRGTTRKDFISNMDSVLDFI